MPESFISVFEENGRGFLTFPNRRYEILIYELESGKLEKKVFFEKDFIFSYPDSEFLIKVSPDGRIIDKYLAKSRYIDKPFVGANKNWDMQNTLRLNCEIPTYCNLIYDKYRKLYYRFVFPETKMDDGEDYMTIIHNGRKLFSIMVLDEDLNVLGETIFPEYTYNPRIFFISKNGLYLSVSHFKRPDFDENILRFQKIELMEL